MIDPIAVHEMTEPSSFFSWWKFEKAPLGLAAQWIAERGTADPVIVTKQNTSAPNALSAAQDGSSPFSEDEYVDALPAELMNKWNAAIEKLMGAIRAGSLQVYGLEKGGGPAREVPIDWFDGCFIKIPRLESEAEIFHDVFNSARPARIALEFGHYENWPNCDGDTLKEKDEIAWSLLAAPVEKIISIRSSADPDEAAAPGETSTTSEIIYRTGAAGKPSSWWLVEQEVRRRFPEFPDQIKTAEIAHAMGEWVKKHHPEAPPLDAKTIKNRLPKLLREIRASS